MGIFHTVLCFIILIVVNIYDTFKNCRCNFFVCCYSFCVYV